MENSDYMADNIKIEYEDIFGSTTKILKAGRIVEKVVVERLLNI